MAKSNLSEFNDKIKDLGKFWEIIEFPNGVTVGPGRSKSILWKKYLVPYIDPNSIRGKTVLDIGCNAGGNLVELSKFGPSRLVGIESNQTYYKQALFVVQEFGIDAEVLNYEIDDKKTVADYTNDLGKFDIIFSFGIIYHIKYEINIKLLQYIRKNCKTCYFSSQLFTSKNRPYIDWPQTKKGHEDLFKESGFTAINTIYEKKEGDDWSGLTNEWYFEGKFGIREIIASMYRKIIPQVIRKIIRKIINKLYFIQHKSLMR